MRLAGLLLLMFLIQNLIWAQELSEMRSYDWLNAEKKIAVFYEGFEDNRNNWDIGSEPGSWIEDISGGKLVFEAIDPHAKEDFITVNFDSSQNFEIETSIKHLKGKPSSIHGLHWGKSENSQYIFFFTADGRVSIDRFSGEFLNYLPFTGVKNYNQDGYNTITIRKINNEYFFFFNKSFVHHMSFKPFFGEHIGFQVDGNSAIEVDYLRVSKILPDEPPVSEKPKGLAASEYHALIIGINNYEDPAMNDLYQSIQDAQKVYSTLLEKYSFREQNMILLTNPTREEMIAQLDGLSRKLGEDDNLLIFYAGHGYWDDNSGVGYWLPADARQSNTANWFRNSTLKDYIAGIKTQHTLLISDACFSGAIFKTRRAFPDPPMGIEKLYELPSRKAMTSGTLKEVPDKSVFIEYLIKRLEENEEDFITSEQLFSRLRTAVLNNTPNVPQYGEVKNTGDEGGDFIFIRKDK